MLRERLREELKTAMKSRDQRRTSTLRLINAALKDRDIAARSRNDTAGIGEDDILQMLQTMVRQRRESIALYEQGGRKDLAQQEREEIAIIEGFMPQQLSAEEIGALAMAIIAEVGASGVKDMGRVMALIKERYAGRMDFAKAAAIIKQLLT
jgi:uncharacterized protein YqeY